MYVCRLYVGMWVLNSHINEQKTEVGGDVSLCKTPLSQSGWGGAGRLAVKLTLINYLRACHCKGESEHIDD